MRADVAAVAVLALLLAGLADARGDDLPTLRELREIQPPGGVPLPLGGPGQPISAEFGRRATQRLESGSRGDLDEWVRELERIIDTPLKGLAAQACRTHFVTRMSLAFDGPDLNPKASGRLFQRAQTLSSEEAKLWKTALEALLMKVIGQTDSEVLDGGPSYAVPLLLIPVDALHEQERYSPARGEKYRARICQLTPADLALWKERVDTFGGTQLDAAVNIILLDPFFENETFRRDRFHSTLGVR